MASYNELNALIDAYINRNGVQAITGQILNGVLKAMVEQLGRGYTIMGAATPATDPGTPDGPECYFASATGTYTDFDGLQVVPGELALLCYTPSDGWTKATIYEGFQEVGATIDGNVGTPSVGVSYANGVLSFDFHNMKGDPGQNGQDGQDGAAAGFGTIGADITGGVGTPGVSVESSGPATAKNLQFHFTNLKGETGVTSVVATVDNTVGTPQCAVSLVGQELHLDFTGLKGAQGDTGSSVDYPFTIVNNLTTNDATQALSAAMGVQLESEISQLELKVGEGVVRNISGSESWTEGKYISYLNGVRVNSTWASASTSIDVSSIVGKKLYYKRIVIASSSGYQGMAFYDSSGTYISGVQGYLAGSGGTAGLMDDSVVVPSNAKTAKFSVPIGMEENFVASYYLELSKVCDNADKELSVTNDLSSIIQWTENKYIAYTTGARTDSTWCSASDYIAIPKTLAGNNLFYSRVCNANSSGLQGVAFYDSTKTYISGVGPILNADENGLLLSEVTVPATAKYMRLSSPTANVNEFQLFYYSGLQEFTKEELDNVEDEIEQTNSRIDSLTEDTKDAVNFTSFMTPSINTTWTKGYRMSLGTITQDARYMISAPIELHRGDLVTINTAGGGISIVYKVDANGDYVSQLQRSTGAGDGVNHLYNYVASEDCTVKVCYRWDTDGSFATINAFAFNDFYYKINRKLRVLVIGNSYSADSWGYVPFILKNYGIEMDVTMCYRGGISLEQVYNHWEDSDAVDVETESEPLGTYSRNLYHCDTTNMTSWETLQRRSTKDVVSDGGWDIISLQQYSGLSVDITTYEPWLDRILALIQESLPTPYTLLFNIVCTRHAVDEISNSLSAQEAIQHKAPINFFSPYGTAIFNARTNPVLAALGDSQYHNLWYDGVHIQEGIPKYIAALAVVQAIFDRYYPGSSVLGDTTRFTDTFITKCGIIDSRGSSVGVTEENCALAQKCAILANKYPFVVTQIDSTV